MELQFGETQMPSRSLTPFRFRLFAHLSLWGAVISIVALLGGSFSGTKALWQPAAALLPLFVAMSFSLTRRLAMYQFTAWIVAAFTVAMVYPQWFLSVGPLDMRHPWLILFVVQLVMFGMGTQMGLRDFAGVARMPTPVVIGLLCQFSIMPIVGYCLAKCFNLPPEIAAGVVLIGSCSSGLASNVMVFLAKGNLALSVTLTTVSTLLAPVMTPLWMKILAGEFIDVDFVQMMMRIIKIVVVPVGAAMVHDALKHSSPRARRMSYAGATIAAAWCVALFLNREWIASHFPQSAEWLFLSGFLVSIITIGAAFNALARSPQQLEKWMPLGSMFGIAYFTLVTTAAGRDALLQIGGLLFLAAVLHNLLGYTFGYWLSRLSRLDRATARTIAIEVGLQNGGMATGLAGAMGKLGTVGLAAAIFSPWMNVSGSLLAIHWRRHPIPDAASASKGGT